mgnify:CR=1 FL=1
MTCNCKCSHHSDMHSFFEDSLKQHDPQIARLIEQELWRQQDHIELIASENIVSEAVLQAQGSVLTNKYAEGYAAHRYYHGCAKRWQSSAPKSCLIALLQMFNRIRVAKPTNPFIWHYCNPTIQLWG